MSKRKSTQSTAPNTRRRYITRGGNIVASVSSAIELSANEIANTFEQLDSTRHAVARAYRVVNGIVFHWANDGWNAPVYRQPVNQEAAFDAYAQETKEHFDDWKQENDAEQQYRDNEDELDFYGEPNLDSVSNSVGDTDSSSSTEPLISRAQRLAQDSLSTLSDWARSIFNSSASGDLLIRKIPKKYYYLDVTQ